MDHAQIQQKHQRPIHKWATTYGRSPKQLRRLLGPTSQNRTIKAHERNKEAEEETRGMIYTIQTGMRFSASTCPSSTPEETGRDRRTLVCGARYQSLARNHLFSLLLHHVEVFLKPSRSPPTQPNFQPLEKSSFYPHCQHAEEINRNTRSPQPLNRLKP
ncbi:hypothetical protein Bca52824_052521 [Brassica carinata]|uniref:Uncharacterized protein n=1 Tax=Brassica carinata TaxID=52824 RepID=A0A8X7UME0_BRACI|nr:hypothetical protein Bca52824_052521 [Brassica carinata]